jgi:hypothetical protein
MGCGSAEEIGWAVAADSTGYVQLAGRYTGTVDFDPDPFAEYALENSHSIRAWKSHAIDTANSTKKTWIILDNKNCQD